MAREKHTSHLQSSSRNITGMNTANARLTEKPVELSMHDVHFYAKAAAHTRGFPKEALNEIAFRIVWLEQRGLPGLTYFANECMDHDHLPLHERGQLIFDPTLTLRCPIYAGTLISDVFSELISGYEDEVRVMRGPTNAFLMLPKLAQYAAELDVVMAVNWTTQSWSEIAARTLVYDHKIVHEGDIQDIMDADGVGISQYTGSTPRVFEGPVMDTAYMSPVAMLRLAAYCGRGQTKTSDIKCGPSDIEKMILHDEKLMALYTDLRPQDISLISTYARSMPGTEMSTRLHSPNDYFWSHLADIGWLQTVVPAGIGLKSYALTASGQAAIPVMLGKFQAKAV